MQLTRRQFFASSAAATFVASLPRGVLATPIHPAIAIDATAKKIVLREPMHFNALHRLLCEQCDRAVATNGDDLDITSIQPTLRITPEIYEFQDDWRFADDDSRRLIRCGSYREGDDLYSSIMTVGRIPRDVDIRWRTDDDEGFFRPGEAIRNWTKPITFDAPDCEEYRLTPSQSSHAYGVPIPLLSKDPKAEDAGTLARECWTDVSEIADGLLVRA